MRTKRACYLRVERDVSWWVKVVERRNLASGEKESVYGLGVEERKRKSKPKFKCS
jgi:hypothetical protein